MTRKWEVDVTGVVTVEAETESEARSLSYSVIAYMEASGNQEQEGCAAWLAAEANPIEKEDRS